MTPLPDGHCINCESKLSAIFSPFNEHGSVRPFEPLSPGFFFLHLLAELDAFNLTGLAQYVTNSA